MVASKPPLSTGARVMVADDHQVIIAAVRSEVEAAGHSVVAEETDPQMVISRFGQVLPDVLILDISFAGGGGGATAGIDLLPALLTQYPGAKVLMYSQFDQIGLLRHAYKAGALGYVTKKRDPRILKEALATILTGERYFMDGVVDQLALSSLRTNLEEASPVELVALLNERERQVLTRLAHGETLEEMAKAMDLSMKTVAQVRSTAKTKLCARRDADMIAIAVQAGLRGQTGLG